MRARCLAMAWRVIGRRAARSVTVDGPSVARAVRIVRRVGSARATKTCSATASVSGGIDVLHQLGQLSRPALTVGVVGLAPGVDGKLGEARLDETKQGAVALGLQGEFDVGATRVVLGKVGQPPGVCEHRGFLHALDTHVDCHTAGEGQRRSATGPQVDARPLAEPRAQPLGSGERLPHLARTAGQGEGALDAVGQRHDYLLREAIVMPTDDRHPGGDQVTPGSPRGSGSAILLGGAPGKVSRAAVGSAGATLGQLTEAGSDEVIPTAAAHVLALELVVQAAVLEGQLARAVVERGDGERRLSSDPVLHEGALKYGPAYDRQAGRLVDADEQRWLIGHHRESQLATGLARTRDRAPPGGERLGAGDAVEHDLGRCVYSDGREVVGARAGHCGLLQLDDFTQPVGCLNHMATVQLRQGCPASVHRWEVLAFGPVCPTGRTLISSGVATTARTQGSRYGTTRIRFVPGLHSLRMPVAGSSIGSAAAVSSAFIVHAWKRARSRAGSGSMRRMSRNSSRLGTGSIRVLSGTSPVWRSAEAKTRSLSRSSRCALGRRPLPRDCRSHRRSSAS